MQHDDADVFADAYFAMALAGEPGASSQTTLTSFPLSATLSADALSPEDASFSILPRYFLQKVKDTFTVPPSGPFTQSFTPQNDRSPVDSPKRPVLSPRNSSGRGSLNSISAAPLTGVTLSDAISALPSLTSDAVSNLAAQANGSVSSSAHLRPATKAVRLQDDPADAVDKTARRSNDARDVNDARIANSAGRDGHNNQVVTRNPRLSVLSRGTSRAAVPVLVRPPLDNPSVPGASYYMHRALPLASSTNRGGSSTLDVLDESSDNISFNGRFDGDGHQNYSTIPGFPYLNREIDDDARSIASSTGATSTSAAQAMRRLRDEVLVKNRLLPREYWVADELVRECYSCNTPFAAWRRKHRV